MKSRILLALAPSALFIGTSALAAPIGGYDAWTVNAGVVTATCPAGHSCSNLDATGNGILQQKVVDNADTTVSYFRTIVTEEGATASDLASVQALGFRIEGQIGIDGGGGNNYTNRSVIKAGSQLGNDQMATMAEINSGALATGSLAPVVLDQEQGLGATTRSMDWHFHENGVGYLELNHYSTGGVANGGTGNEGTITVRRSSNVSLGGTLTLDPGGVLSGTEQTLAYAAGNSVTAVWLTQAASGVAAFTNRTLGLQRYTVVTFTGKTNVGGTSITASNADGQGNFTVILNGVASEISGTQFGWNTALFGTRPQEYFTGSISSGVLAPPAPGTFANDFVIP
ncbi:MAG: hypothetical protein IT488_04175 [Gammaproteobacteria bacterium]|nr:hypothetical protein [Gammaproteobacteria bacterium]